MGTEMSHQQNDDHTSQPSQDGSQSCEMWMFEHIVDAMTQLRSIWTEINAPPPATIERYVVLSASETLHDSECPICQGDYDEDQHPGAEDEEEHYYEVFYDEEEEQLEAELEARLEAEFEEEHEEEQEEEEEEEEEEEQEQEEEWEWEWEEAEQVLSPQQREQRDRHWANLTEVSNILQNIETIAIPPLEGGGHISLALQVVRTDPTIQDEDRALRQTLTRLWNESRYLNELLCINFERKQEEQQREILRAERERNVLQVEMMQFTANFRRM
ncbi:uncharacterized protein J4E79_011672 [Alternaria viburni]|uniref:uncharacterized protein n=1 Tax=Alternaria viburni TaxID=566460 RepID=UPI0020C4FA24|nr:uncharacterized protein J4E79_011672 [Alternaria viburni]KAI4641465.1 hypothetical protein J4E79_011672 [Alternaria viburni]